MTSPAILWASLHAPDVIHRLDDGARQDDSSGSNRIAAILIVDGRDTARHIIDLPALSGAKALAAAGFALEDQLAQSIDDVHIALKPAGDGRCAAEVVDKASFDRLLKSLRSQGYDAVACYSEYSLCLAAGRENIAIEEPGSARVFLRGDDVVLTLLDADLVPDTGSKASTLTKAEMVELADNLNAGDGAGVNLMQGAFKPRANLSEVWLVWRRAAVLCAVAIIAFAGTYLWETASLQAQIKDLDDKATRQMAEAFPGVRSLPHMRQRLNGLSEQAGDPFLTLSSILFEAMNDVEGVALISLRYDRTRNALSASLELIRFEDVRALNDAVARYGGRMTEGASRQSGQLVVSDIQLDLVR